MIGYLARRLLAVVPVMLIVATIVFMTAGFLTVYVIRHIVGA